MPHYTEMNCEEVQVEETTTKTDNKNKNLGKFQKKAIYLNHGKYGYFLNHNKINYKIPEWLPVKKLDLEIASKLIEYKLRHQKNKKKIAMNQNTYIIYYIWTQLMKNQKELKKTK